MTELFEKAIAAVSKLPTETQDEFARLILALVGDASIPMTLDEANAIAEAEDEIARGERVAPESIRAFWRTNGL